MSKKITSSTNPSPFRCYSNFTPTYEPDEPTIAEDCVVEENGVKHHVYKRIPFKDSLTARRLETDTGLSVAEKIANGIPLKECPPLTSQRVRISNALSMGLDNAFANPNNYVSPPPADPPSPSSE